MLNLGSGHVIRLKFCCLYSYVTSYFSYEALAHQKQHFRLGMKHSTTHVAATIKKIIIYYVLGIYYVQKLM